MRAVSPIIATVILVAITISICLFLAVWVWGVVKSFMVVEKPVIVSWTTLNRTGWIIYVQIKNMGTCDIHVYNVFVNNLPYNISTTIPVGEQRTIKIFLSNKNYIHGQWINIYLQTGRGYYVVSEELP